MNTETKDIATIFGKVLEIDSAGEREAYLERTCGHDADLRRRLDELLQDHAQAGDFLNDAPIIDTQILPKVDKAVGTQIGPYKLREVLGEGGMGTVYVAEQTQPVKRTVALKVIKIGMDTREVIARFEAERQALALMDHPHIAKVLDAGTTDTGRPYFVMELIRGIPITDYCDQRQFTPRERLELFIKVCQGVQHAHQKGIIHRDLKPSNILVTQHDDVPVPKVIDFGVAKATEQRLTEQTIYTRFAQVLGSPLYMSPEQAEFNAMDIDTRSDIYSLGVLLYELLTGRTPFDNETLSKIGLDKMRQMIREDEPPRPSLRISTLIGANRSTVLVKRGIDERQLVRTLRGDLDLIIMKALEKNRERRYESVTALTEDVGRYLGGEPVAACPPSALYRLKKYASRNRGVLVTTTLLVVTLLAGTGVSVWQAIEAKRQREVAESERIEANRHRLRAEKSLRETLFFVDGLVRRLFENDNDVDAANARRMEAWNDAAAFYRRFLVSDSERDQQRRLEAGIANVHLSNLFAMVGDDQSMESALIEAENIFQRLAQENPSNHIVWLELAEAQGIRARDLIVRSRQYEKAFSEYSSALDNYTKALSISPDDTRTLHLFSHFLIACPFPELQDTKRALKLAEHAMKIGMRKHDDMTFSYSYALLSLVELQDRAAYRQVCADLLALAADRNTPDDFHWASWTSVLAPHAVADHSVTVTLAEKSFCSEPHNIWHQQTFAFALYRAERYTDAISHFMDVHATLKSPGVTSPAYTCFGLAMAHQRLGHTAEARQWLTQAVEAANKERAGSAEWNRRLTMELFQREAEELIGPPYPKAPPLPETPTIERKDES